MNCSCSLHSSFLIYCKGNIEFSPRKSSYNHDESVIVKNCDLASIIATLLGVSENTLVNALTSKRANVHGEVLVINYRLQEVGILFP